ncbi:MULTISPECIES: hypothetical protein [Acidithiobacillus]|uniref:Uncharacterized protein n=2 Tax=Acidithiobacillus TaxID=119977 RepID=A0A179BA72_ACIFR|nr:MULTISPECIES: hypothetical protein [Acidithiobacillus]MBU2785325.1 hypothetical protein [Acidithiobacillus ferriphilus]MEB8476774.1 hypothetical protein [Acidithiobacillus ferriphilus]MEB8487151.1 hypothetical protein [Acidithiobacillus ferriphilus]MEB8489000.1 hypothetical protein [Acidithiobacillus ferriphilus]MEB8494664.1 hypothetical protein [Acidithiobacillus ferriphilus]
MSIFSQLAKPAADLRLSAFELAQDIDALSSKGAPSHEEFNGAHARAAGHYVCVRYHHDQEPSLLSIYEARRYLAWLRAGHVGTHWNVTD